MHTQAMFGHVAFPEKNLKNFIRSSLGRCVRCVSYCWKASTYVVTTILALSKSEPPFFFPVPFSINFEL